MARHDWLLSGAPPSSLVSPVVHSTPSSQNSHVVLTLYVLLALLGASFSPHCCLISSTCLSKLRTNVILHTIRMTIVEKKKNQEIMRVGKNVDKLESLYTSGGNVKWFSRYSKQYNSSSKS